MVKKIQIQVFRGNLANMASWRFFFPLAAEFRNLEEAELIVALNRYQKEAPLATD